MKKKIFILLFMFFLGLCGVRTKASSFANSEFLPIEGNYFESENFKFIFGDQINKGKYYSINRIRIKPSSTYYIFCIDYQGSQMNDVIIKEYDKDNQYLSTLHYTEAGESNNKIFSTSAQGKYLTFEISYELDYGSSTNICNIEDNLLMTNTNYGNSANFSRHQTNYNGANVDLKQVEENQEGYYITESEDPISYEELIKGVRAIDDADGDITSEIVKFQDTYTENCRKKGLWKVVLKATDKANNFSLFTINVQVLDNTKPVVRGETTFSVSDQDNYDLNHFYELADVWDNSDGSLTDSIQTSSDTYSNNKNKAGQYAVKCFVEDSSSNRLEFTMNITVVATIVDTEKPTFQGTFTYETSKNEAIPLSVILQNITASDDIDGDVTKKIYVKYDDYTFAPKRVGVWKVQVGVRDKANNEALQDIVITVKDTDKPTFFVDNLVINIDLRQNTMSARGIIDYLIEAKAIDENSKCQIVYDEYSDNKTNPGDYHMIVNVDNEYLSLTIKVLDKTNNGTTKKTLLDKILAFFVNIWNRIRTFFKRIF